MITKLHIDNFKAFKELDMNFSNLNVFAGINGIGKSSVIQVLLLLRQSFTKIGSPGAMGIYLKGDIINLGTGKDVFYSEAENETIRFLVEFNDKDILDCVCNYDSKDNILQFKNQILNWDIAQSLFSNKFQYLGAQRAEPAFYYPMDSVKVEKLKSLGKYGEYTAHFIAANKRKEIKHEGLLIKEEESNYLLNQLIAWINKISPGVSLDAMLYPELNLAKVAYSFTRKDGYSASYNPVNVGFGYSYLLPVLTAILSAEKDALLIIENPESHLHPRGQAVLGKLIALAAKSGIQLFIETHSDHIINGIRIAIKKHGVSKDLVKTFFFDREEGEAETEILFPVIDRDGRLSNLPKGFLDEYSNQLDQLLM
jgi:predicted ATPase